MQAAEVEQKENVVAHKKFPVKKTDFSIIGSKAQLQIAMALTGDEPDAADFDNFPRPSAKEIAALKKKAEEEARKEEEEARALEEKRIKEAEAAAKPKVKSTTKVEQVSTSTNEVVRVWVNADDAASTMQLSLNDIQTLLSGVYDADIGDEVGGYRWRYADEDAVVTEKVTGRDSKKGREAYLEFRDKLYDSSEPHVYKGGNRLRDYQIDGVNWLSSCYYKEQGCILADEVSSLGFSNIFIPA
jgi:SNF2 family DNA or RNA helicase